MRLNWRGSVRSQSGVSPGRLLRFRPQLASSSWSVRNLRLHVRQGTIWSGEPELVGAKSQLARAAVDHRVGEAGDVARGFPHARVEDDGGVEDDDVVALLHHRAEPELADVVLGQDAVVAVVVC